VLRQRLRTLNSLAQDMAATKARLKTKLATLTKADVLAVEGAIQVHLGLPL